MFANCLPYIFERTFYQSTKQQVPYLYSSNYTLLLHCFNVDVQVMF